MGTCQDSLDFDSIRAKQNIVFCSMTLIFNTITVIHILMSRRLRTFPKFHIIANMSTANIIASLVFFPVDIQRSLGNSSPSDLSSTLRVFLQGMYLYCAPSVLALSLVVIGVDYMANKNNGISVERKALTSVTGILLTWFFSSLSFLPFTWIQVSHQITSAAKNRTLHLEDSGFAEYSLLNSSMDFKKELLAGGLKSKDVEEDPNVVILVTLILVWGILPWTLAFVTTVSSIIVRFSRRHLAHLVSHDHVHSVVKIRLLDTVVSTLVCILLSIPYAIQVFSSLRDRTYCLEVLSGSRDAELTRWSIALVLPAVWLLDDIFRETLITKGTKICQDSCVIY